MTLIGNPENNFVRLYKNSRKRNPRESYRDTIFQITASVIADTGTLDDLKALNNYYNYESEVMYGDKFAGTI